MMNNRGTWGSNIGFLFAAVGSAIGFGTVWAFPYKMGKYGGFTFLAIYLVFAAAVGISLLICELAIGRKTGKGPIGAYSELSKKYPFTGVFAVLASYFIMIMYASLGGYCLEYVIINIKSFFTPLNLSGDEVFTQVTKNTDTSIIYTIIFVFINYLIVKGGIQKGIEKFSIVAIPMLFISLIIVICVSLCAKGASEGLKFMFLPDYGRLKGYITEDISIFQTISAAGSQLFFSLSIGMGATIAYGSYLNKKENLIKNAVVITLADTLASVMSGLAVIPAAVATGIRGGLSPDKISLGGPKLLFVSLQEVFIQSGKFGSVLGVIFFVLILIAAISSAVSLIEVIMSYFIDRAYYCGKSINRSKTAFWVCISVLVFGIFTTIDAFGTGGINIFGRSYIDLLSLISEAILMPVGAYLMTVIVTDELKTDGICDEISKGAKIGKRFKNLFYISMKFFVPVVIGLVIFGAFFG